MLGVCSTWSYGSVFCFLVFEKYRFFSSPLVTSKQCTLFPPYTLMLDLSPWPVCLSCVLSDFHSFLSSEFSSSVVPQAWRAALISCLFGSVVLHLLISPGILVRRTCCSQLPLFQYSDMQPYCFGFLRDGFYLVFVHLVLSLVIPVNLWLGVGKCF